MPVSPAADLPRARELCDDIISSIASTSISRFAFRAPVIDRQTNLPYDHPLPLSRPPSRNETGPDSNAAAGPSPKTKLEITANAQLHGSKRPTRRGEEALWKNGQHKGSTAAVQNGTGDKQGLNTWCQTEILGWNRFISGVEKQKAYLDEISKRPDMIRESPLPSVQSSATLWKQILIAHTPITGVRAVMRSTGDKLPRRKPPGAIGSRSRLEQLAGGRGQGYTRSASPAGSSNTGTSDGHGGGGEDSDSGDETGATGSVESNGAKVGKRQARRAQRALERATVNAVDDSAASDVRPNGASSSAGRSVAINGASANGSGKKTDEVVIDVVARGGAEWIKIYTKKEAQLLAEFREQDSYLCSDWSDSDSDPDFAPAAHAALSSTPDNSAKSLNGHGNGNGTKPALTNSIIDLAHSILAVAHATPRPPGTDAPKLTMRFTRMSATPISDEPRISETFDVLRGMGVKLVFGDLADLDLGDLTMGYGTLAGRTDGEGREEQAGSLPGQANGTGSTHGMTGDAYGTDGKEAPLLPSLRINLDPTALVGLCCDLLHHPLHTSIDEARKRYFRPRRYLHDATGSGAGLSSGMQTPSAECSDGTGKPSLLNGMSKSEIAEYLDGYDDLAQSQHSRELFKEAIEEASAPLIEEMRDLLGAAVEAAKGRRGSSSAAGEALDEPKIEWYATPTALRHLREAMGNTAVVGQGREQMRMRRLIGMEEGDFFEGSRYEGKEGALRGIRVRELPDRDDALAASLGRLDTNDGGSVKIANAAPLPSSPSANTLPTPTQTSDIRSFHHSLASATSLFLSEYTAVLADPSLLLPGAAHANLPPFLRPERLPVPKVANLTLPLPIVSLMSMQRGAEEGMTTLSMGNVVFRELWREGRWKCRGWTQGGWEIERAREFAALALASGSGLAGGKEQVEAGLDRTGTGDAHKLDEGDAAVRGRVERDERAEILSGIGQRPGKGHAVMWLMPYRSLGEGKRVRFEAGDYAFPASLEQGSDE